MNENELQDALKDLITDEMDDVARVSSFEDQGIMTNNAGLVIRMADGSEFQLTIVKSR